MISRLLIRVSADCRDLRAFLEMLAMIEQAGELDHVRIHLDEVAGLGSFVEFEAVLGPEDDETTAHARLEYLGRTLQLNPSDHRGKSYADLLGL